MQRLAVVLAAINLVLVVVVGFFVIHGSARGGCAEASQAAALAWQAVALAPADEAAAEIAVSHAAGEVAQAEALATGDLWAAEPIRRVEQRKLLRGKDGMLALATAASVRAAKVCQ
jgi:hypothetical protein